MSTTIFPPANQVLYGTYDLVEDSSRHTQVDGSLVWKAENEDATDSGHGLDI